MGLPNFLQRWEGGGKLSLKILSVPYTIIVGLNT